MTIVPYFPEIKSAVAEVGFLLDMSIKRANSKRKKKRKKNTITTSAKRS
jgi:hypothetical protein